MVETHIASFRTW